VLEVVYQHFSNLRGQIEQLPQMLAYFIDPHDEARISIIIEEHARRILQALHAEERATEEKFTDPLEEFAPATSLYENSASNSASLEESWRRPTSQ